MSVEADIETALVDTVRDLYVFDADHKAWPNMPYEPPRDPYLRFDHFPNSNDRLFIGSRAPSLYLGILQLTVVAPLNAGTATATELAGAVAEEYPPDRAIFYAGLKLRIQKAPDVGRPLREDATWQVPVSIRYEVFATSGAFGDGMLDFSQPKNSQYIPLI